MMWGGGARLGEDQVDSLTEGGSGPSRENFKDEAEDGGDRGNDNKEEDYEGSEHEPSANRVQDGAGIAQGIDELEPEEQRDPKEQQDPLQLMFQTLICKLKVTFKSSQIQSLGNRRRKEALVWYIKLGINDWCELGAEAVIPKWDPRKHNDRSMEVDIMIAFDKQDCPP